MSKYRCMVCGHIYDTEEGDTDRGFPPGTAFEDLPETWTCPECGSPKDQYEKM